MHVEKSHPNALQRWWFTALLLVVLVAVAILTTPAGRSLAGEQIEQASSYMYYVYLSLIFK